jgi:hypothetical protein
MRRRKSEKQEKRKGHFGIGASNLRAYRETKAKQCLQEIGKTDDGSSDDDHEIIARELLAAEAIVSDDALQ